MTEIRRNPMESRRYGFTHDELEGEECVECGEPATVAYEDVDGTVHYCDKHDDPENRA